MANLTYRLRGKSPRFSKLDYQLQDGELISVRPINFKLTVEMDPDRPGSVDCEVKVEISTLVKNYYVFDNGLDNITESFNKKEIDFDVDIGGHVIMSPDNINNMDLIVYLSVKGKGGNTYPAPITDGEHRWDKGEISLPLNDLLDKLRGMNKNLKDLI